MAKVISIKDDDFQVLGQIPLTHFVKSICFYEHEDCSYLALLQVDGLLKVFNIVQNNPAPQLFKVLSGPKSDMKGKFQLSCKDGVLGVLYGGKTLRFYNLLNDFSIISESDYNASILSFELVSKDAALISSVDEKISLFAMAKCQVIKSISYTNVKTSSIAAADETFACIFDSIKSELFQIEISINQNDLISAKIKREEKKGKLEKLKKKSKFLDDSASASDDEESEDIEDEEEELDEEDEGIVGFSEDEVEGEEEIDEDEKEDSEGSDDDSVSYTSAVRVKKHPVVQPCCTQFRNLSRYLAYNNIGFITCRQELDQMDLFKYDIEFMDRGSHQPIRFDERVSYDLAALGDKGAVFASTGVGAELKYKSFDNSDESWNFPLPLGTEPIRKNIYYKSCLFL